MATTMPAIAPPSTSSPTQVCALRANAPHAFASTEGVHGRATPAHTHSLTHYAPVTGVVLRHRLRAHATGAKQNEVFGVDVAL